MSKGKTGIIILTVLAAMFFLFVAILFGSSKKRQGAIDRKAELDAKLEALASEDLAIYWIGQAPVELEKLSPVIRFVAPQSASNDNLPVKGPSFSFTEYTEKGAVVADDVPIEYPSHMLIVITGTPELTENGTKALLNSIAENGVPVIAVGDDASELLCTVLSHRRVHSGEGSSIYYCRGKGYTENPLPESAVVAGGADFSNALADYITSVIGDYTPAA